MNIIRANKVIILLVVLFISAIFLAMIRYFFLAIFLAAIFSALAAPIFHRFSCWFKEKKSLSAALTMLTLLVIVFLPLAFLLGIVAQEAIRMSSIAAPWVQQQMLEPTTFDKLFRSLPYSSNLELYRENILQKSGEFASQTGSVLLKYISSFTVSAVNDLFLLFVFLYAMFFFIRDGKQILENILSYLPMPDSDLQRLLDKFLSVTRATLKGCVVLGILQGTLAGIAFRFAGIDNAIFLGAIMSVLLMFPILGPPLTWVFVWIPSIIFLAAGGQYFQAIGVFLFLSVVVHPIDNIFRPILVGRDTQLHELLIFFGTLGGIGLFGIFGIFIGPIIAALFMTAWEMFGETFKGNLAEIKEAKQETHQASQ
ncbi:MAG: AI-2E family transporter [Chlorobium sp.]|nr:MAG: AI-2E family transporter [Chlorobium sp.]